MNKKGRESRVRDQWCQTAHCLNLAWAVVEGAMEFGYGSLLAVGLPYPATAGSATFCHLPIPSAAHPTPRGGSASVPAAQIRPKGKMSLTPPDLGHSYLLMHYKIL